MTTQTSFQQSLVQGLSNTLRRITLTGSFQTIGSLIIIVSMLFVGRYVVPKDAAPADKILYWAFAVFTVGISELFAIFVLMAVWGKVDLAQAFSDKTGSDMVASGSADVAEPEPDIASPTPAPTRTRARKSGDAPTVSLSRLQVFMWTLIVLIVYFHRVVTNRSGEIPTIPPELLMVMGISGAVYLTSKGMETRCAGQKAAPMPKDPAGPSPVSPTSTTASGKVG